MARSGWHLYDAHAIGIESGNITFWTAMVNEVIPPHTGQEVVLDYGCGDGQFLRLLHNMRPFSHGLGVDIDPVSLEKARQVLRAGEPIKYGTPAALEGVVGKFDLVFSQEVFWMIKDLEALARTIYRVVKDKGEYNATVGCHIENPLWPHRRRLLTGRRAPRLRLLLGPSGGHVPPGRLRGRSEAAARGVFQHLPSRVHPPTGAEPVPPRADHL